MTTRGKRLQRLLAIRRIGEELGRRRLQSVLASVMQAETALGVQRQTIESAAEASRCALQNGDRSEWLFSEAQSEVASWNRGRLMPILQSRHAEVEPAISTFLDRRLEHEQVQQLIKESKAQRQLIDDRRQQAFADNWFLTRRSRNQR